MERTTVLTVEGEVAPGFEGVRDVFEQNLSDAGEGGFAYAAYRDGHKVVDLWTGWPEGATPLWMSTTKAFTALCIQILCDRGKVDVNAPIAIYWSEFASAGKETVTVADVLTHRSGVLGDRALTDLIDLEDGTGIDRVEEVVQAIAGAAPVWDPGTQTGYHTLTYGWILGELIRRVDGRSLGTFFREEVALPLGVPNVRIGSPPETHENIPQIFPMMWPDVMPEPVRDYMSGVLALARDPSTPAGISCVARDGIGALDRIPEIFNNTPGRAAELGGSNLAGTAAGVARVFAELAKPENRLASPESFEKFTSVRNTDEDVVLLVAIARALGYWRNIPLGRPQVFGPNEEAFGHTGAGGQMGFADPKAQIGAAYVRSHHTAFGLVPVLLNGALYASLS
jgi:CubicO group peptidase (beta-lactamase class C family)